MTLTTTRWNSPATLTCSSHRKDARCCRWGQRLKLSTANSPHNSRPSLGGWGRGHVSCPHSWADSCHRRSSPAGSAQPLVGCPQPPSEHQLGSALQTSPRNVPCAIPVYLSNGLPWQQLCATGTIPVLAQSFSFFFSPPSCSLAVKAARACKRRGLIRSQRMSVFTLGGWREASVGSGLSPSSEERQKPRGTQQSGHALECNTCRKH